MKKLKAKPSSGDLRSVRLFLDDIQDILDVMGELPGEGKAEIQIGNYELSSLDEVSKIGEKTAHSLEISYRTKPLQAPEYTQSHFISLDIEQYAFIHCLSGEDTPEMRGVVTQIEQLLKSKQRWWRRRGSMIAAILGAWVTGSLLLLLRGLIMNQLVAGLSGLVMLLVLCVFGVIFTALEIRSTIVLTEKAKASSFWSRNHDALALNLIIAVVVFVFGLIAGTATCRH